MKQLIYLIPSCTDREALNLAVYFHETFIIMERWRVCCHPLLLQQTTLTEDVCLQSNTY